MMQRTANENAAYKRRICKRSDQPKIEIKTEIEIKIKTKIEIKHLSTTVH